MPEQTLYQSHLCYFQHQLTQQNRQTGLEGLTNFHGLGAITGEDVSCLLQ